MTKAAALGHISFLSPSLHDLCQYSWTLYCGWNLGIGRETGFPSQTLQRWYTVCTSHPKKWIHTWLCHVDKSCYLVLILDSHTKRLLLSLLSYPDVNTIWKLPDLSGEEIFFRISKIPVIRPHLKSRDSRIPGFHFCLWIPALVCCPTTALLYWSDREDQSKTYE